LISLKTFPALKAANNKWHDVACLMPFNYFKMKIESPAWYCARTKPKHEHIAAANLRKNLNLEVFIPGCGLSGQRGAV